MRKIRNSILSFAFLCAALPAQAIPKATQNTRLDEFAKTISQCLESKKLECLENFIPGRMYFPEQKEFECVTADKKNQWHITPKEFAECAQNSSKKRTGCGDNDLTLKEVLRDCFANPKTKRFAADMYFKTPGGSLCHLSEEKGKLKISRIGCEC